MRTGSHRMHGLDGTAGLQRTGLFTKSSSILIQRVAQLVLDSASISPSPKVLSEDDPKVHVPRIII